MTAVVSATTMQPSALRLLSESWSALSATAKRPIEPSSGGLFKWLKEGNELNFTPEKKKKKKITGGEYGSHSAANKGGRPKKGPWSSTSWRYAMHTGDASTAPT